MLRTSGATDHGRAPTSAVPGSWSSCVSPRLWQVWRVRCFSSPSRPRAPRRRLRRRLRGPSPRAAHPRTARPRSTASPEIPTFG